MRNNSARKYVFPCLSIVILIVSTVYLLKRSVLERAPDIDFRYIWTAGKLWAQGIDPYSPRFLTLGRIIFATGNPIDNWLYPPQWWAVARSLAELPAGTAVTIWRSMNAVLLVGAAGALAATARRVRPATPLWAIPLAIAIASLMEGTAQTLLMGQTSILVFAGFCLMGCALLTARQWLMVLALLLLLLKPQFGFPVLICFAAMKQWRLSVLIALIITGLASLPQITQYGLLPTLKGLLGNMAIHGHLTGNWPENLPGFAHFVWEVTGLSMSNEADIALDLIASGILSLSICWRGNRDERDQAALGIALMASAMFFLPVHDYDMVALTPVAMLGVILAGAPRYLTWAAVALAFRPGFICAQFGNRHDGDLLLLSLAGLLALIAAISAALARSKAQDRLPGSAGFEANPIA